MAIDGEGMPLQGHPFEKGNLYIQFSVVFPLTLEPAQVDPRPLLLDLTNDPKCLGSRLDPRPRTGSQRVAIDFCNLVDSFTPR